MSSPRLTPDEKAALLERYLAGEKVDALATAFGVDRSYPAILARRRGIARRTGPTAQQGASR